MKERIEEWNQYFKDKEPTEILKFFIEKYGDKITFSTSLGAEDQVLIDMLVPIAPTLKIFTLDTGRLFPETYELIDRTNKKYGIHIETYFPDYQKVEKMVRERGINLFYESVENRKLCCHNRKVEPLKRAFQGMDAWISGLRREQSVTRKNLQVVQWDDQNELIKISPLINWSYDKVWDYIKKHKVPYNPLHNKGFPSIGCQPCTRAIMPGEDIRAGRWWWENPELKECGLHKG